MLRGQLHEQHAESQEQQVGWKESQSIAAHIFLCFAQPFAREVFLHHVLIQPRHHHHHEDATEKLFPEILSTHEIIPHKDAAVFIGHDGAQAVGERIMKRAVHLPNDE